MSANDPARPDAKKRPEAKREGAGDPAPNGSADRAETRDDAAVDDVERTAPEAIRAELEEAQNRVLRSQAELENYRKRVARQMEEERRYANLPLMRDLLHVWDDMGRAIEAAEKGSAADGLLEGFKMVARQLENVLERHHCIEIDALGQPFDPHKHEAISQQPSEEYPPGTVAHVARSGFQLHDRVVRPSQVIVAAAPPEGTPSRKDEPDEPDEQGRA